MKKIIAFIRKHKIISFVAIVVIIGGSYFSYQKINTKESANTYTTATAEKGMLISSIFGTGQISASNQVEVKPKVSGDVVYVGVKNGQEVKKGELLVKIDDSDAKKAVRDVEVNLETAQISLSQAESDFEKTYNDGLSEVTDVFIDLPDIMLGLEDILFSDSLASTNSWNLDTYKYYTEPVSNNTPLLVNDIRYISYHEAKKLYEQNFDDYKSTSISSDQETIKSLIDETYQTTEAVAEAVKSTYNLVRSYKKVLTDRGLTVNSTVDTYLSNLSSYISEVNNHIDNLYSIKDTFETSIGSVPYSIRTEKISVEEEEDDLNDAKENLANHYIYASFDGIVATIDVEKGDSVSSATALATLVTTQKIAEVSLNEIDVAQVQIGQKANLAFDAVEDLSITGKVVEVDILGTNDQGVVSYGIKIAFDLQDERIKPGMSVTANIITESKQNVISVPNSAVKSQQGVYYVQVMAGNEPRSQQVEVGISNDTMTEIVSGLKEGDVVVTGIISQNSGTQATQTGGFQLPGTTSGMGGTKIK